MAIAFSLRIDMPCGADSVVDKPGAKGSLSSRASFVQTTGDRLLKRISVAEEFRPIFPSVRQADFRTVPD